MKCFWITAALLTASCSANGTGTSTYPEPAPMKTVVPDAEFGGRRPGAAGQLPRDGAPRKDVEAEVERMLERKVELEPPLRTAFVWIDRADAAYSPLLPEEERARLAKDFLAALPASSFRDVVEIPRSFAPQTMQVIDVDELRTVAARFQSDVLIVLNSASARYTSMNFMAWTYVALVPMLFVPGDDVAVYSTADACVFDVRTGLGLGCKRGFGKADLDYILPLRVGGYHSTLAGDATGDALKTLPIELGSLVPVDSR